VSEMTWDYYDIKKDDKEYMKQLNEVLSQLNSLLILAEEAGRISYDDRFKVLGEINKLLRKGKYEGE
tara:strand:- start:2159 stop:2359 length:201 start_codon:yes stop_codon:yes gene_type:complete